MKSNLYKLLYSNSLYSNYKVSFKRVNIIVTLLKVSECCFKLVIRIWLSLIISAIWRENNYGKR